MEQYCVTWATIDSSVFIANLGSDIEALTTTIVELAHSSWQRHVLS